MKFAIVDNDGEVLECKSFAGIAADAASRLYPLDLSTFGKDKNAKKREETREAIYRTLNQIALDVLRR